MEKFRDGWLKVKGQAHVGPRSNRLGQWERPAFEWSGKNLAAFDCHSVKSFVPSVYICLGKFKVREEAAKQTVVLRPQVLYGRCSENVHRSPETPRSTCDSCIFSQGEEVGEIWEWSITTFSCSEHSVAGLSGSFIHMLIRRLSVKCHTNIIDIVFQNLGLVIPSLKGQEARLEQR